MVSAVELAPQSRVPVRALSTAGLVVLALAALDLGLEAGIVVPALPVLAQHYDASLVGVSWLVTGFLLASAVAAPLFGRLGDIYGKRRVLLVSLAAFALGSLLCALTDTIAVAIAGRIIQGFGAATGALVLGLIRDTLPAAGIPRGIGLVVGATALGGSVGLILSGVLVDRFGATSIFWFLLILALVLIVSAAGLVGESPVRAESRVDIGGVATLGGGLALLLLAVSKGRVWGWSSADTVGTFVLAGLLLVAFVAVERRVRQPLVDLRLLVGRSFLPANACTFVFGYVFLIAVLLIPLFAATPTESGYGLGLSTIGIGWVLLPNGLAGLAAGLLAGKIVHRVGPRALVACGAVLGSVAYISFASAHDTRPVLMIGATLLGLGWGLVLTGLFAVVMAGAHTDETSVAFSVNTVVRFVAVSVGGQVAIAIVTGAGLIGPFPAESGYTRAFLMGAVGACVLLVLSFFLPSRARLQGP
jgi:MFS family permease